MTAVELARLDAAARAAQEALAREDEARASGSGNEHDAAIDRWHAFGAFWSVARPDVILALLADRDRLAAALRETLGLAITADDGDDWYAKNAGIDSAAVIHRSGRFPFRDAPMTRDACARCRDGAHWECHGCGCPCSYFDDWIGRDDAWEAAVNAVHPPITTEQRDQQWAGTYPQPSRADLDEPIIGGEPK